jgi:hypothetical protein
MEMDNLQKGLLIAGGLLLIGFLGYTLFARKQEEIEDAEYIIVVDTNSGQTESEKIKKESEVATTQKVSKQFSSKKVESILPKPETKDETEPISYLKKVEEAPTEQNQNTNLDSPEAIDLKPEKEVSEIEVVAPQEVIVEANDEFPLKLGSKGQRVFDLKVYLMKNHGGAGIITNDFDAQTAERVKRFLKVDQVTVQHYKKLRIGQNRKKKRNATKT